MLVGQVSGGTLLIDEAPLCTDCGIDDPFSRIPMDLQEPAQITFSKPHGRQRIGDHPQQ